MWLLFVVRVEVGDLGVQGFVGGQVVCVCVCLLSVVSVAGW